MQADYIQRLQAKIESETSSLTSFTPTINPISRELATKAQLEREAADDALESDIDDDSSDDGCAHKFAKPPKVVERLVSDAEKQVEKRIAIQEYYDAVQQQPFAPMISEHSSALVQHKPEFQLDFVTRQRHFQRQEQAKFEALEDVCERAQNDGERITFTPDIGNADVVLRELRPDRVVETKAQQLYRMIYNDPKQTELKKQRLRDEQFAKYTFKPQINPISKALGRSTTLAELAQPVATLRGTTSFESPQRAAARSSTSAASRDALKQYFAGKRFRSRVALEMDQAAKAECTFQPTLIAKPPSTAKANRHTPPTGTATRPVGSSSSASKACTRGRQSQSIWRSDNILHLIETDRLKKAEALEAKRNALELRELQECTFAPNLRKTESRHASRSAKDTAQRSAEPAKPVIVRGLGRFLEMKEQAKRLRAEQQQREERAFRPNTAYEPRSYTVPKPFKLSESSKETIRRRLQVRQEMRAREQRECTFAPQTLESKHRKVLKNLLRE